MHSRNLFTIYSVSFFTPKVSTRIIEKTMTTIDAVRGKAMPKVDTQDTQYQVSDDHKPDKEGTWPFPAEKDSWVVAHDALRGEMSNTREALEAIKRRGEPLKEWEVNSIKQASNGHIEHVHAHHTNEDEIFVPEVRKFFNYPDKLTTDHVSLVKKLEEVDAKVKAIKAGDTIDDVLNEWTEYENMMRPHLQEEEDVGLPLLRAYMTQKDVAPIIQKLIAKSTSIELGSMIHFMGAEKFRKEFMPQEGIPFFVWFLEFKGKYNKFLKIYWQHIEALQSGVEPKDSSPWFFFF